MGFGLFKKIKDAAKKTASWLKNTLPKVKRLMDNATPAVKTITHELPKYTSNQKVKNFIEDAGNIFDVANSGIDAIDSAVNKQKYEARDRAAVNEPYGVKNWVNYNIAPRLKTNH